MSMRGINGLNFKKKDFSFYIRGVSNYSGALVWGYD